MQSSMMKDDEDGESRGPSREEIETLCLLHTIGPNGGRSGDLTARMGLAPGLVSAVAQSVVPLVDAGWVVVVDDRFHVTEAGQLWMEERLAVRLSRRSQK